MQGIARLLLGAQVRAGLAELNGNCMLSGDCCALVYRDSAWHCRRAVLLLQSCVRIVCCAGGTGLPVGVVFMCCPHSTRTWASEFGPVTLRVPAVQPEWPVRCQCRLSDPCEVCQPTTCRFVPSCHSVRGFCLPSRKRYLGKPDPGAGPPQAQGPLGTVTGGVPVVQVPARPRLHDRRDPGRQHPPVVHS